MAASIGELCDDLLAERDDLEAILSRLDTAAWDVPSPAPGWSVRDQVTHLAWFDEAARQAIAEPDEFRRERAEAVDDIEGFVEAVRARNAERPGAEVTAWLRAAGQRLTAAARSADPAVRVPWYGPDMTVASCLTARIMETWAHGQDIADAVGVQRPPSPRLRHVAFIAARAFANSFVANDLPVPSVAVRLELTAPDGEQWVFGPPDATETVVGPALDFCLLATQRCHRADTALVATGRTASTWLDIAQAFAGPPGAGRAPSAPSAPGSSTMPRGAT